MSISENTRGRGWYRWHVADFRSDPAVQAMTQEQRWRYRDALDSSWLSEAPGVATPDQWRRWMGYTREQWESVWQVMEPAFHESGRMWIQKRMVEEYQLATSRSRAAEHANRIRWGSDRIRGGSVADPTGLQRGEGRGEASSEASRVGGSFSPRSEVLPARASAHARTRAREVGGGEHREAAVPERNGARAGSAGLAGDGRGDADRGDPPAADRDAQAHHGGDAVEPEPDQPGGGRPDAGAPAQAPGGGEYSARDWAEGHEQFYAAYPRKAKPRSSLKAWLKIRPRNDDTFTAIMDGLDRHKVEFAKREPDKIPHPATWLNAAAWEGEP